MGLIGTEVTVLGAGVAGLAVARALALRGAAVTVLEQAAAIAEVGAGIQVSPNGACVMRALGLGDALEAASFRASAVQLYDGLRGAPVLRLDLARLRPAQGYHFMHRAALIALLEQGARDAGVVIRLGQRVVAVGDGVTLASGEVLRPLLLVGADGLHSLVRAALNGVAAPFFTGQVAWRAVIPAEPGAVPVAEVHMGEGRHLVSYPLPGGLRNIVAVEERSAWAAEGWHLRDDPATLRTAFASFGPRVQDWLVKVQAPGLWGLFRHPVARRWQGQGMVLLGDAAHPTLPFLAQGANMALEDAWVLAACLAQHDSALAGLAAYQAARAPRCARIVAAAEASARAYHLHRPWRGGVHLGMRAMGAVAPQMALRRFDWIYGCDVTA